MDDEIRPPDKVIKETLINNFYNNANANANAIDDDDVLTTVLELSKLEFEQANAEQDQLIINKIKEETKERIHQFKNIKQTIKKLLLYDKQKNNIYNTILSAIEMYEEGYIASYILTKKEYDDVVSIFKSIRLSQAESISFSNLFHINI